MATQKKKTTKAVTEKSNTKELLWLGGQKLLGSPATEKDKRERVIIELISRALDVSVFGVTVLGGNIYLNKLGLTQKVHQYCPNIRFEYEWVHIAGDDKEKAICKCRLMNEQGKGVSDWILGECSPITMKMRTLNGYQNHMAQTRAKNRAILETFGVRIHEEMLKEVEELYRRAKGPMPQVVVNVGNTSAEEMQNVKQAPRQINTPKLNAPAGNTDSHQILEAARKAGIKVVGPGTFREIEKVLGGGKVNWNKLTKSQASEIVFKLLAKANGQKNGKG